MVALEDVITQTRETIYDQEKALKSKEPITLETTPL